MNTVADGTALLTHDTNVLPIDSAVLEGSIATATVALAIGTTVLACDYCESAVGCLEGQIH